MTKKAKDLCIGDRVIFPGVGEITVTQLKVTNQEFVLRVGWSTGSDLIRTETELTVLE